MRSHRHRTLLIAFCILFSVLQYKLWFSSEGIVQTLRLSHRIGQHQKHNKQLLLCNQAIIEDIHDLKSKNTVESLAREKLGMIKSGERYYQFVQE